MNAFAVMPCTCSPTRVVRTVTPVANMPSVRRNAIAGSPSRPSPSSSASASGAASNEAPNASGAEIASRHVDLELLRAARSPSVTDSDPRRDPDPPSDLEIRLTGSDNRPP